MSVPIKAVIIAIYQINCSRVGPLFGITFKLIGCVMTCSSFYLNRKKLTANLLPSFP